MGNKVPHPGARKLTPRQTRELAIDISQGMTKPQAAAKYGIHLRTVYRILRRDDDDYRVKVAKEAPKPRKKKPTPPPRKLKPHGTNAAYMRHMRKHEIACDLCVAAHAEELRLWRNGQNPAKLREKYAESAEDLSA